MSKETARATSKLNGHSPAPRGHQDASQALAPSENVGSKRIAGVTAGSWSKGAIPEAPGVRRCLQRNFSWNPSRQQGQAARITRQRVARHREALDRAFR